MKNGWYINLKKYLIILLILLIATMGVSCTKPIAKPEANDSPIVYSNLLDDASRIELRTLMLASGIAENNVDSFFNQVDYFNEAIGGYGLVREGFKEELSIEPKYDPYQMQDLWDEKNLDFIGYNCRITSFQLLKDLVQISSPQQVESEYLVFDEMAINSDSQPLLNTEEIAAFRTLYYAIPTIATKDVVQHVQKVQEYYQASGISFTGQQESLITVYFHDEEGFLFVGHVGVLFAGQGELVFVEKVAFQEPYQVIKFNNRKQLSEYLIAKYNVAWGQETPEPFIIENGKLLDI